MKPETLINRADKLKRTRPDTNLLDAVEGISSRHKAVLVSRIMKEVIAGRITATEASNISKAGKT